MSEKKYLSTNPDIVFRKDESGEGAFLFNSLNCSLKGLNSTGELIWAACDGTRDLDGVVQEVVSACDGAPATEIREDVTGFVELLIKSEYIVVRQK